jgi:hypothetical protein
LSDEPFDPDELQQAQAEAFAAIWGDAELDEYNDYDAYLAK